MSSLPVGLIIALRKNEPFQESSWGPEPMWGATSISFLLTVFFQLAEALLQGSGLSVGVSAAWSSWGGEGWEGAGCTHLYSVQFSSITQLCLTLCDPRNCSTPGFPVHHQLPELIPTHVHRVGDVLLNFKNTVKLVIIFIQMLETMRCLTTQEGTILILRS